MASGLDVASAVAGMISVSFQIFQGCIQGYKFIRSAQSIGSDGDFLRARLLYEQIRLEEWAKRAGLEDSSLGNDRLNWSLINQILDQVSSILTSAEKFKRRYGLDIETVAEVATAVMESGVRSSGSPVHGPTTRERGIEKFFTRLRPEYLTKYAQRVQSNNGTCRRIKWAAVGKDDMDRVVSDLTLLNDQLVHMLEVADSARIDERLDALLRGVLSLCAQPSEVKALQQLLERDRVPSAASLAAAATLKNIRLAIGVDKRSDELRPRSKCQESGNIPQVMILNEKKLAYDVSVARKGIALAKYNRLPVLIQWKEVTTGTWDRYNMQMRRLALLLGNASDESFHGLPCLGLLLLSEKQCFGLVYEIPAFSRAEPILSWTMLSLYDMFTAVPKLSLSTRLKIAQSMAQAVLQLHTVGWLHKGIRSVHVVFLAGEATTARDMANTSPYLIGHEHARPDADSATTELVKTSIESDLYRHPDCRGSDRDRYAKRFDMYAFGCLLVEIALWNKLVDIHSKYSSHDWASIIVKAEAEGNAVDVPVLFDLLDNSQFADDIRHSAGDAYWSAVKSSLSFQESITIDKQASLEVQQLVLKGLLSCYTGDQNN